MRAFLLALAVLLTLAPAAALAEEIPMCAPPSCEKGAAPKGLRWEKNDTDPVYADPRAQKGGTLYTYIASFPLTLRTVGPDSNDSTRPFMLGNHIQLTYYHPNTRRPIPGLAYTWAFEADHKTTWFKLDPKAVWSDGKPVTAYDVSFALALYRSKDIVAPWYNDHYTNDIDKVIIADDRTFAIVGRKKRSHWDELYYYSFDPLPRHFYDSRIDAGWPQKYQWEKEPDTGPYQITTVDMGNKIVFERKKDWWGRDLRYFKGRYNVDRIVVTVIRDPNVAWEYFKKGKLDGFTITQPDYWHDKAVGEVFDKGYVKKLWFYNQEPQPEYGMWMNMDYPLFKDKDVRLGFQYSMNVDKVLKTVLRGDYERLRSNTEGYGALTNKRIPERPFDLAKADHYFALAGWGKRGPDGIRVKDGQRLAVTVTYGRPAHTDRLVVLKEEAKKAGVELNLQLLDDASAFKTMLEKKHQIAYSAWAPQDLPEYWGQYSSENAHKPQTNNFANIADPELDKWIELERNEFDEKKEAMEAQKIQQLIFDSACFIPTWKVPYWRIAYWRWLKWPKPPAAKVSDDPVAYPIAESQAWDGMYWIDQKAKDETEAAVSSGRTFPASTVVDKTYKD